MDKTVGKRSQRTLAAESASLQSLRYHATCADSLTDAANSRTTGESAAPLIACVCFGISTARAPEMLSATARTAALSDAGLFPPPTTSVGTRIARNRDDGSSKLFMM